MAGRLGPSGSPDAIFRRPNGLTERYQEFVKRKASLDEEKRRLKENRSSQKKTSKPGSLLFILFKGRGSVKLTKLLTPPH